MKLLRSIRTVSAAAVPLLSGAAGCDSTPQEVPVSTAQSPDKGPQATPAVGADGSAGQACGTVGNLKQVPLDDLLTQIPELNALPEVQQQQVAGWLNVVPAPCCACWQSGYIAECLLEAPLGCENLPSLKDRAITAIQNGVEPGQVQALLSYGDYWFSHEKRGTSPIDPGNVDVEVWVDPDAVNVQEVLGQVASLKEEFAQESTISFSHRILTVQSEPNAPSQQSIQALNSLKVGQQRYANMDPAAALAKEQVYAKESGVRSGPTWFVNGYRLRGQQSDFAVKQAILREMGDGTGVFKTLQAAGD